MPVGFATIVPGLAAQDVVLPAFAAFQAARVEFAQEVAKLALPADPVASRNATAPGGTFEVDGPEKVLAALEASFSLMPELRALLDDLAPAVRENAMLAIGRLCGLSDKLHGQIAEIDTLGVAVSTIGTGASPALIQAALFLLHTAVRSSAEVAQTAVDRNALGALCERLEDTDSSTKIGCIWCLAAIASHDATLAGAVVESGSLPLLLLCLKESSLPLRRLTLSCLGSIAKHSKALAEVVNKEGGVTATLGFLASKDVLLRRQTCRMLACALQHHDGAVEWVPAASRAHVIETMHTFATVDPETCVFAATLVQQIAKRSASAAAGLHDLGVVPLLVAHIAAGAASPAPAAAALGHICDAVPAAAAVAIEQGVLEAILPVLSSLAPVHICAVMCAALGAMAAADESAAVHIPASRLVHLMAESTLLSKRKMGTPTRALVRTGFSKTLSRCSDYASLVFLIEALPLTGPDADAVVLAALLKALARLLSAKGSLRLDFMQRGALTLAQDVAKSSSSDLREALKALNSTFPAQMVAATDPNYEQRLLEKIS
uniref:Armadillo repeat-containing protein 8 n=1 Tax=Haptolina brevifila TaxID=156173 RepID=A0A7S2CLM5_9EUKA|mmetsp:Transcript_26249/g.52631  ORF Transcript_26249/g.52631 Transcript_26249/m.52631 type:complete len:548 (+) Transcript_26249:25-1668(+)